ncbi:MAG: hypothetical protein CL783_00280 [Chloroflexi bacterium]|nr:hypothetical protein [Chloroflexota bacterium]|tara:strand:+ start:5935 stop:7851 length:1917 start_codon:yes stop_codon:yes gene_type:complete
MPKKWSFPPNGGGLSAGANDGAIDHFKGYRLSSVVREVAQNSLDARKDDTKPVSLNFRLFKVSKSDCPEVVALKENLEQCCKIAEEQQLEDVVSFYSTAIQKIDQLEQIPFLGIHDSNTTGLTGPVEGPSGAWHALVKGSGLTQKADPNSLGSYGHGSKAPFTLTDIRSLFYFSTIETERGLQRRFQGKSILQSHRDLATGTMTQGTGFYGEEDECRLLLDDQIPQWALNSRQHMADETGTSILIPFYSLGPTEEPETAITLIANFFYAIKKDILSISVGDREIDQANVEEQYALLEEELETEQDEIDVDRIKACFQGISAIVYADQSGTQEISDIGTIEWYLRLGEDIDRCTVSLARQNGMLITRAAPYLVRFPQKKPFEMFVCVRGDGSSFLKRLENPTHDHLEFDRIDDKNEREIAKKKYRRIERKIRSIINQYASIDQHNEVFVDELRDLFSEISEESTGNSRERSKRVQISNGPSVIKKAGPKHQKVTVGDGQSDDVPGRGERGGDGKEKTEGGGIPDARGKSKITGPSRRGAGQNSNKSYALENIRARSDSADGRKLALFFDSPGTGTYSLELYKKGETDDELVLLLDQNNLEKFDSVDVDIPIESGRTQVSLATVEDCSKYALTARVVRDE